MPLPPPSLSVVIMAYNEESAIASQVHDTLAFIDRLGLKGEVIAVDDGSLDGTGEAIEAIAREDSRVKPVHHPKNLGMGVAIRSGYQAAEMEFLTQLPGDGQVTPDTLQRFLPLLPEHDLVLSTYTRRGDGMVRRFVTGVYQSLARLILGDRCDFTGTMVFRRALLDRIRMTSDTFMINVEVPLKIMRLGVEPGHVEIEALGRSQGRSKVLTVSGVAAVISEMLALRRELMVLSADD